MAYQNGTATSPTDLLQKLATFLTANGWTQDSSVADGAGWRLHVHKGTVYANFRAAVNEGTVSLFDDYYSTPWSGIAFYLGDGYSSGSTWKNQSGSPKNFTTPTRTVGAGMVLPQGAITGYHFFADATGDNISVVVEKSASVFTYMVWGTSMQKLGTWTGGPYFCGGTCGNYLSWTQNGAAPGYAYSAGCPGSYGNPGNSTSTYTSTYVKIDVDAFTGKWVSIAPTTTGSQGYTGKRGSSCVPWTATASLAPSYSAMIKRLTSQLTGQSLMLPIRLLVNRDAGGNSFIGSLPNIFITNACLKGFTPGALYNWGTDQYRVFPGPTDTVPNSNYGYAIKQV